MKAYIYILPAIILSLILSNIGFSQCGTCTLTNPAVLPNPIPAGTIVCITTNTTYAGATFLTGGAIHVCSGARLTLNGAVFLNPSSEITTMDCSRVAINGAVFNLNPMGLRVLDNCDCDSAIMNTGALIGFPVVCSPLPIELASFEVGVSNNGEVKVEWATTSEINNSHFIIERSTDVISWEEIATVQGAGNSNEPIHYSTVDRVSSVGNYYYRLTQVDYDGNSETFSNIKSVFVTNTSYSPSVEMYPNPASDYITFNPGTYDENYLIEIINLSGLVIKRYMVMRGDIEQTRMDISELENGVFIVRCTGNNLNESGKLIVSR